MFTDVEIGVLQDFAKDNKLAEQSRCCGGDSGETAGYLSKNVLRPVIMRLSTCRRPTSWQSAGQKTAGCMS